MEHDIRELFKSESIEKKELPNNHREDFMKKLKHKNLNKREKKNYAFVKIIASFLLIFSCVYFYKTSNNTIEKTAVEIQVEMIEKDYLINIDREWNNFLEVAKDAVLIKKYQTKLKESDTDYKRITKQLKEFPNDINLLESLINNLQRRLQLVKEINEHIKELNQKNTSNETIYI